MGFFSTDAKERAKKTRAAASRAERTLLAAIVELRQMENLLMRIEYELPKDAPGNVMRGMQKTMELTERHADHTLTHLHRIKVHLRAMEAHLNARKK